MPGLVPGIRVLGLEEKTWMAGTSPAMTMELTTQKIFFIIFIDAMFTILFERPFTNPFDAARENPSAACV
jgi:hypothetical protein